MNARPSIEIAKGVTLIELVITLAIAGFLLLAVVPNIAEWMRNTQIRNAAESVEVGLQRARTEAIRRNVNVRFTLVSLSDVTKMDNSCAESATGSSWVVSLNAPAGKCGNAVSADPFVLDARPAGDGSKNAVVSARLADNATGASSVTFDAFGRVTGGNPISCINVSYAGAPSDTRSLRVLLSTSGSAFTCDPNASATDPRACPKAC